MQEKLIDILSSATAWMTATQIAYAGNWRSPANVGVALQQMEKSNCSVERRKSPTQKQSNGMPATEWKLVEKHFEDITETKMGRKPKHPPLEPETMPTDKECCNAAKVVATTAGSEVAGLREKLSDIQRELDHANAANGSWLKLAAEHECKSVPDMRVFVSACLKRIDDLKAELGHARIQINALNEQLMIGASEVADVKDASFFAVYRQSRGLQRFKKIETAKAEAEVGARVEGQAELYAMVLVDVASKGAIWKGKAA